MHIIICTGFFFWLQTRADSRRVVVGYKQKYVHKLLINRLYPHFTKDYFGPDSTRSPYMVDWPHIWESNRGLADNHGQSPGKVWRNRLSPTRVGYRKRDWQLFLNMFKNGSRSEPVRPRSSWSSEGPLKVFLSRQPSGVFVYPLKLSSTLESFRILTAAQSAGDLA